MNMKTKQIALAVACMMAAQGALALNLYNDTLTWASGGITATANWDNDGTWLSWDIAQNPDSSWTYAYTWKTVGRDLSHLIFEVTEGAELSEFTDWWFSAELETGSPELGWVIPPHPGNPGLPGPIYGIKMDLDEDTPIFSFSFSTMRAPVWGNFYAKDGRIPGGDDVFAYNAGFLNPVKDGSGGHIAVPNGPSPGPPVLISDGGLTLGLLGLSLFGMGLIRRRRTA